jgi:hypothetical protein
MSRRFRPTPEADTQTVLEIAREIESLDRVPVPTAAELAERRQRDAEYERRRRERDRIAAAEREQAEREELAEQERLAQEQRRAARFAAAEQARAAMAERQRQMQEVSERRRLGALANEWSVFKAEVGRAQAAQRREDYVRDLQATISNVTQLLSPPPAPVEQVYVSPPDAPSGRLGDPNFDPSEMGKAAIRWR